MEPWIHDLYMEAAQCWRSLPFFLPSFFLSFLPSLLVSLPSVLPSHRPIFLPSYLPTFLPSYLLTFLPSYLPTFLLSYFPSYRPTSLPSYRPFVRSSVLPPGRPSVPCSPSKNMYFMCHTRRVKSGAPTCGYGTAAAISKTTTLTAKKQIGYGIEKGGHARILPIEPREMCVSVLWQRTAACGNYRPHRWCVCYPFLSSILPSFLSFSFLSNMALCIQMYVFIYTYIYIYLYIYNIYMNIYIYIKHYYLPSLPHGFEHNFG
jgi:hypothetical protein